MNPQGHPENPWHLLSGAFPAVRNSKFGQALVIETTTASNLGKVLVGIGRGH